MIYSWRDVLDDWKTNHGGETRILMTEAYANLTFTMRYYQSDDGLRKGSHIPFNFLMISDLKTDSTAFDFAHTITKWMSYMPAGETANWVVRIKRQLITNNRSHDVFFLPSSVTMTILVLDHASAPNVLTH